MLKGSGSESQTNKKITKGKITKTRQQNIKKRGHFKHGWIKIFCLRNFNEDL